MVDILQTMNFIYDSVGMLDALIARFKDTDKKVKELQNELEQREETAEIYEFEGLYSLHTLRKGLISKGVKKRQFKNFGVTTDRVRNITFVVPLNFLSTMQEYDEQVNSYNGLLRRCKRLVKDIKENIDTFEGIAPNDLHSSGIPVKDYIVMLNTVKHVKRIYYKPL